MHYVYILQSSKSGIHYYGYTVNLKKRIVEHNKGQTQFTKGHMPWKLVWYCGFQEKQKAKDFELYLKSGSGKAFVYKRLVALTKDESQIHYYNYDRIHTALKMPPVVYARLLSDNLSHERGT